MNFGRAFFKDVLAFLKPPHRIKDLSPYANIEAQEIPGRKICCILRRAGLISSQRGNKNY
jgi:hypothetical protein